TSWKLPSLRGARRVMMLMMPPEAPRPCSALAPWITSIRSIIAGSMVCASREPSRSGVDCGTPSTMYSGWRPRSDSPKLDIFWREGANAGIRLASTCDRSRVTASCSCSSSAVITVMVLGSAASESGRRLVDAETVTLSKSVTWSWAWAGRTEKPPRMAAARRLNRGIEKSAWGRKPGHDNANSSHSQFPVALLDFGQGGHGRGSALPFGRKGRETGGEPDALAEPAGVPRQARSQCAVERVPGPRGVHDGRIAGGHAIAGLAVAMQRGIGVRHERAGG